MKNEWYFRTIFEKFGERVLVKLGAGQYIYIFFGKMKNNICNGTGKQPMARRNRK